MTAMNKTVCAKRRDAAYVDYDNCQAVNGLSGVVATSSNGSFRGAHARARLSRRLGERSRRGMERAKSAMTRQVLREFASWKDAIEAGDTFKFARVSGDRDLLRHMWLRLRDACADPLSADMLAVKDLELAINGLVETAEKFREFEAILSDTSATDCGVIERLSRIFYG